MKMRLLLLGVYFIATPMFVLILIFYQLFLHHQNAQVSARVLGTQTPRVKYSAVPDSPANSIATVTAREARVDVLTEFFTRYNSPLKDFADEIVDTADKYGLDYRLLPAIAMQESTLCLKAPVGTNNCWGYGIYGKKKTSFDNLSEAIDTVSQTLARDYHGKGLIEPIDIMSKYTPSNSGDWAENVSYVMARIASAL